MREPPPKDCLIKRLLYCELLNFDAAFTVNTGDTKSIAKRGRCSDMSPLGI